MGTWGQGEHMGTGRTYEDGGNMGNIWGQEEHMGTCRIFGDVCVVHLYTSYFFCPQPITFPSPAVIEQTREESHPHR